MAILKNVFRRRNKEESASLVKNEEIHETEEDDTKQDEETRHTENSSSSDHPHDHNAELSASGHQKKPPLPKAFKSRRAVRAEMAEGMEAAAYGGEDGEEEEGFDLEIVIPVDRTRSRSRSVDRRRDRRSGSKEPHRNRDLSRSRHGTENAERDGNTPRRSEGHARRSTRGGSREPTRRRSGEHTPSQRSSSRERVSSRGGRSSSRDGRARDRNVDRLDETARALFTPTDGDDAPQGEPSNDTNKETKSPQSSNDAIESGKATDEEPAKEPEGKPDPQSAENGEGKSPAAARAERRARRGEIGGTLSSRQSGSRDRHRSSRGTSIDRHSSRGTSIDRHSSRGTDRHSSRGTSVDRHSRRGISVDRHSRGTALDRSRSGRATSVDPTRSSRSTARGTSIDRRSRRGTSAVRHSSSRGTSVDRHRSGSTSPRERRGMSRDHRGSGEDGSSPHARRGYSRDRRGSPGNVNRTSSDEDEKRSGSRERRGIRARRAAEKLANGDKTETTPTAEGPSKDELATSGAEEKVTDQGQTQAQPSALSNLMSKSTQEAKPEDDSQNKKENQGALKHLMKKSTSEVKLQETSQEPQSEQKEESTEGNSANVDSGDKKGALKDLMKRGSEGPASGKKEDEEAAPPEVKETRQRPSVVFHKDDDDKDDKMVEEKKSASIEVVVEVNPALALLSHLGLADADETPKSGTVDPYLELLKKCTEGEPSEVESEVKENSPRPEATQSPTPVEKHESTPMHTKASANQESDSDTSKPQTKKEKEAETTEPPTVEPMKPDDQVTESKKPETQTGSPDTDLLGFLGSNYDDLFSKESHASAPAEEEPEDSVDFFKKPAKPGVMNKMAASISNLFGGEKRNALLGGDEEEDKLRELGMSISDHGEGLSGSAIDELAQSSHSTGKVVRQNRRGRRNEFKQQEEASLAPPSITSEGMPRQRRVRRAKPETSAAEPTPSVAPPSLAGESIQRGARRIRRAKPKQDGSPNSPGGLAPPSLAGDSVKRFGRGVRRSQSDEGPSLAPPSLVGDDEAKKGRVARRARAARARKAKAEAAAAAAAAGEGEGEGGKNQEVGRAPAPADSSPSNPAPTPSIEEEPTREGDPADSSDKPVPDEDAPRKVTRKEANKAKKFAMLEDSEDDDDLLLEKVQGEAAVEKKKFGRGMLRKAQSAMNVVETTKNLAKKAHASSRNLFG